MKLQLNFLVTLLVCILYSILYVHGKASVDIDRARINSKTARKLLSTRNELLKTNIENKQQWGWGKRQAKKIKKMVTKAATTVKKGISKAATTVKKSVTKAATTVKKHVTKAVTAVKDKFDTNNDVSWEEPAKGTKFGIAMPGGGIKAIFGMWQILYNHGFQVLSQAPMVSTNSGSSWGITQFLFTKDDYFSDFDDRKTEMDMSELYDDILEASFGKGKKGSAQFDLAAGMLPSFFNEAGPNWVEHLIEKSHKYDGWNEIVDDVNRISSYVHGRSKALGPKLNLNWAQHIVLLPQGSYEGPSYRYCPVGHKSFKGRNHPVSGTFRVTNGFCEFCPSKSWKNLFKAGKCQKVPEVPRSKLWSYRLTVVGVPDDYPSIPGYATKQTSNLKSDTYKVSFPFLKNKRLQVKFSPVHGKATKSTNGKHYFFKDTKTNPSNLLDEDRISLSHINVKYAKIIKETERYYNDLWEHKRARLGAISSSASALLNSKKLLKTMKLKLGPIRLKFAEKIMREILDEDYDSNGNIIFGEALKPDRGWVNLRHMIFNGGLMGAWPGVGSATQITMGKVGSSPLQFSFADGGYADNFGIAAQLQKMSQTGKTHPFISLVSMDSFKGFSQFFSERLCPYTGGLMRCAGTTNPIDDYGFASYDQPNLIMFEGLPFDGPSKACQKDPNKDECPTVHTVKADLTTVHNKFFGIKGGIKVKIIFLFFNPGHLSLLPSTKKKKEMLESARRLRTVFKDADVEKYLV